MPAQNCIPVYVTDEQEVVAPLCNDAHRILRGQKPVERRDPLTNRRRVGCLNRDCLCQASGTVTGHLTPKEAEQVWAQWNQAADQARYEAIHDL